MKKNRFIPLSLLALTVIFSCKSTQQSFAVKQLPSVGEDSSLAQPQAQDFSSEEDVVVTPDVYQPSATIINDIVKTKLDVHFDWTKQHMMGKAWITFKPHFNPTDSLTLDAKSFDINKIELVKGKTNIPLKYTYKDSVQLKIKLDRSYARFESYTIFIDYTSKPNEVKQQGSAVINDAKGLYFINPDGKDLNKPREVWTQGETESNSCWFPTIDKPNMKTTLEISITAEKKQVTLSNGLMTSSKQNADGTHTDTWKLDKPFAPYLVMMAVGPFSVVKDKWKSMEVNYYVDSAYAQYAKKIFGKTPEMIQHFSDVLGFPYPWPKYSQVIAHDYVSGAMENVSATLHGETVQQTAREMIDNDYEDYVSHELFHQWFGDLVTTESWSNITLNESMADYGEYIWNEYKHGKDEADLAAYQYMSRYLNNPDVATLPLVQYTYKDREDVFSPPLTYYKGGRILNMLRNYVGDSAFFKSLNLYLNEHKYQSAEVADLRLAFEKISGEDLNWFFNQWYFNHGHPVLNVSYQYNADSNVVAVTVKQTQHTDDGTPIFKLPVAIDVYVNGKMNRYKATFEEKNQTLTFPCEAKPDLVNFDGDKMLLCRKTVDQSDTAWAFQFNHAPKFLDRLEAVQYFNKHSESPFYKTIAMKAMNDKFWYIRQAAAKGISKSFLKTDSATAKMKQLATLDQKSSVRAAALTELTSLDAAANMQLLENALNDSSYLVITTSLGLILSEDTQKAYALAQKFKDEKNEDVALTIMDVYAAAGDETANDFFLGWLKKGSAIMKYQVLQSYGPYLARFADNSKMLDASLPLLYDLAQNASEWYVRFRAVYALQDVSDGMEKKEQTAAHETLAQKISEIKDAEKDERLKSIYSRK